MSSTENKAVFLSYASQDAEAAKRIADALRAAGVEVWFDQSELAGGDTWDAKIRGQIGSCGLFMPVISANTQARLEGYFRLEWKLAAQRTHTMAEEKAFLLPILLDGTRDAEAKVPAEFKAVQWTKLPAGETPPAFVARVKKLLDGSEMEAGRPRPAERGEGAASPKRSGPSKWWWALPIFGVTMALLLVLKERRPAATVSAASAEISALRAQLVPDRWQQEDYQAMAPRLDRIIRDDPDNADAWALRSLIESLQVTRNFDPGTKPLESGKNDAERALRLAPQSPLANLAMGMHLVAMISRGGDAQACRPWIDRAVAALPAGPLTRYCDGVSRWLSYEFAESEREMNAWLKAEPHAGFPNWIMAQLNLVQRRTDQAEQFANEAAQDDGITGIRARYTLFETSYYLRADLGRAREILQGIPASGRTVHRVVHARWVVAMAGHRWDDALQELARLPENFLFDRAFHGPKALLAGLAHARAGRADAAKAQFREAERLLREHLATDPDNEELHAVLAVALACLDQADAARNELALVEPLVSGRVANVYRGSLVIQLAQARCLLGDYSAMATWVRKLFAEKSAFPFTPASFALDPRFSSGLDAPEIRALLQEFAALAPAQARSDDKSVAVLAFANLSDDKANEYFSDGISEELLNVLAKVSKLKVAARTSSFSFKGQNVPIPEIAHKLGVAYVVEGSVRKAGNKVRITAQLIKASDGFHVWSETYDRELSDIFAVQDEIAKNILGVVKGSLLGEGELPTAAATKPEAYALFLEAQGQLARRSEVSMFEAERLFKATLALDPDYVPALVGLARTQFLLPIYGGLTGPKALALTAEAKQAAEHALRLNPQNAGALTVHGSLLSMVEWRWADGEAELLRARELAPNDPWVINLTGDYFIFTGNVPAALAAKRKWTELDPLSATAHWDLGFASLLAKDYDQAIQNGERARQLAPTSVNPPSAIALGAGRAGRFDLMHQALVIARRDVHENEGLHLLLEADCAILEKRPDEAHRILAQVELLAEKGEASPAYIGYLHLLLGESDLARTWLQRGYDLRDAALTWAMNLDFAPIAADPKTRSLLDLPGLKELYEIRQRNARAGLSKP